MVTTKVFPTSTVRLGEETYLIYPQMYRVHVRAYFAEQRRSGLPTHADSNVESVIASYSWHRGMGLALETEPGRYFTGVNIDPTHKGVLHLGPFLTSVSVAGLPPGREPHITAFATVSQGVTPVLFGVGDGLYIRASDGSWSYRAFPTSHDGAIASSAAPLMAYIQNSLKPSLYVGFADGHNLLRWDLNTQLWEDMGVEARFVVTALGKLWRVASAPDLGWSLYNSADGISWSAPLRIGPGTYTPTWLWTYIGERVMVSTTNGVYAVDKDGVEMNILPEWERMTDPLNGEGAGTANYIGFIPSRSGLWEIREGTVLATPIGGGTTGWDQQSPQIGRIHRPTPVAPLLMAAALDAQDGSYHLLLRRFHEDAMEPGRGWHPVAQVPQPIKAIGVWGEGGLLRLYIGTPSGLYLTTLLATDAVPGLDGPYNYAETGEIVLPWMDLGFPFMPKFWAYLGITQRVPLGTAIDVYVRYSENDPWMLLGTIGYTGGGQGAHQMALGRVSYRLQLRLVLKRDAGSSARTPYLYQVEVHALLRPPQLREWIVGIVGRDGTRAFDLNSAIQTYTELSSLLGAEAPVKFRDPYGSVWDVWVDDVQLTNTNALPHEVPGYVIQLRLLEARVVSQLGIGRYVRRTWGYWHGQPWSNLQGQLWENIQY